MRPSQKKMWIKHFSSYDGKNRIVFQIGWGNETKKKYPIEMTKANPESLEMQKPPSLSPMLLATSTFLFYKFYYFVSTDSG